MKERPSLVRRVRIDRLELDVHGIAPATVDGAARALGPALARALASHPATVAHGGPARTERADAGRLVTSASPDAHGLAALIAGRVARTIGGGSR